MKHNTHTKQTNSTSRHPKVASLDEIKKAELRRQMYERIAEGNQFVEAENIAHGKLHKA